MYLEVEVNTLTKYWVVTDTRGDIKMITVKVNGLNLNESRNFEILPRIEIEKEIEKTDFYDIYERTYGKAEGYSSSGTAFTYISVETGEIETYWQQQNNYNHPCAESAKIILCSVDSPKEILDEDDLLDFDEQDEYGEGIDTGKWKDLDEYMEESGFHIEERKQAVIRQMSENTLEYRQSIEEQLDELYGAR